MIKFSVIFLIFSLILFTAIIKNSTKRIDDEIFVTKENIRSFKKDYGHLKLEYDYLSSAEKLHEFKILYFENELFKKDISNIKQINKTTKNFQIKKFNFIDEK
tara:strand:+ start:957 stop:1265 length:309 start_codon:yes stop_codon:yes gene_type:complete